MEAFCELFFDNLATLLGVTGSAVGHIGFGLIAAPWRPTPKLYNTLIAVEWEKIYYEVKLHYTSAGFRPPPRSIPLSGFPFPFLPLPPLPLFFFVSQKPF